MKTPITALIVSVVISTVFAWPTLRPAEAAPVVAKPAVSAPVTVTDNGTTWTLDNGIVRAVINKSSSNMLSLTYHGINLIGRGGFWEQKPSGQVTSSLTIDPAKNGGERAEVAIKGVDGRMDLEVRYVLERGVSGFYTYAQFSHGAEYPATGLGESRFILQMVPTFDWLSVDADRNMLMCSDQDENTGVVIHAKEQKILSTGIYQNSVEHKYSYCGVMYQLPAYGWSSTKDHVGIWFINPDHRNTSSGGPYRDSSSICHISAITATQTPSSSTTGKAGHYDTGAAGCNILSNRKLEQGRRAHLSSTVNSLADQPKRHSARPSSIPSPPRPATPRSRSSLARQCRPHSLAGCSRSKAKWTQNAKWPYDWVNGVDYPHMPTERANVSGQIVLNDPQAATTKLLPSDRRPVGLTRITPDSGGAFVQRSGNGIHVTWEHAGNYYQFWNDGSRRRADSPSPRYVQARHLHPARVCRWRPG